MKCPYEIRPSDTSSHLLIEPRKLLEITLSEVGNVELERTDTSIFKNVFRVLTQDVTKATSIANHSNSICRRCGSLEDFCHITDEASIPADRTF